MRIERRNVGLGLAVLALGAYSWFAAREAPAPTSEAVLPRALSAERIELTRGVESLVLERRENWSVTSAQGFPAFEAGVERFLRQLSGVRTTDEAATNKELHERLGVGDEGLRLRLDGGATFVLGEAGGAVYLRREDDSRVLRAATVELPSLAAAAWIETQPFLFDASRAARVRAEIMGEDALVLELTRRPDGRWLSETGRTLAPALVTDWLRGVGSLVAEEVGGSPAGSPALTLEIDAGPDEPLVRLQLYRTADEPAPLARDPSWNEAWCVRVPGLTVRRIENGLRALAAR